MGSFCQIPKTHYNPIISMVFVHIWYDFEHQSQNKIVNVATLSVKHKTFTSSVHTQWSSVSSLWMNDTDHLYRLIIKIPSNCNSSYIH